MRGTFCLSPLLGSLSTTATGGGTLPCSVLLKHTMQLFVWQCDVVGVAHYISDCFDVLGALYDASSMMHPPHLHQPWRSKMDIKSPFTIASGHLQHCWLRQGQASVLGSTCSSTGPYILTIYGVHMHAACSAACDNGPSDSHVHASHSAGTDKQKTAVTGACCAPN